MDDPNQFEIPESFVALYLSPGRARPSAARTQIAQRYDLCEDMAQHLGEYARAQWQDLGVTEVDVLRRCHDGLRSPGAVVSSAEAGWVVRRLAELQGWSCDLSWLQAPA